MGLPGGRPDDPAPKAGHPPLAPGGPGPEVDLRIVLLTASDERLLVGLAGRDIAGERVHARGLPRGRPAQGLALDATASALVRRASGLTEHYFEQLYTMSVDQSTRGSWKVVVCYMALVPSDGPTPPRLSGAGVWCDVADLPALSRIDHDVIAYSVVRLQAKLGYTSIARHLLPDAFTLRELQALYETVIGQPLDKRNFRRRMQASGIVARTDGMRRDGSHRPAALYAFLPEADRTTYLTPPWTDHDDSRRP